MRIKNIAILTSGGDASGMNAAVRAVVRTSISKGINVFGIYRGYTGLMNDEFQKLNARDVSGIINRGGTILYSSRSEEFKTPEGREIAISILKKRKIDALIVVGGDGSFRGAYDLAQEMPELQIIGIPGTIDNDIAGTDYSIGYDTALRIAVDAIDNLRDTAFSHERMFVVEVMGRKSGQLAVSTCLASGADAVLIPETISPERDLEIAIKRLVEGKRAGKKSSIIVIAEGFPMKTWDVSDKFSHGTGFETRFSILGHIQRGGIPTPLDRMNATRMGTEAVYQILVGESNKMVGIISDEVKMVPIDYTWKIKKEINHDFLKIIEKVSI